MGIISRFFTLIRRSLRAKIVAIFAATTILPVGIVGVVSFGSANSALREQTTTSTIQLAGQLTDNIDLIFRDSERFLKIGNHKTTVDFLNPRLQSEEQTYRLALEIIELFKLFRDIYEFDERVKGIYILGFNGNSISEREGRLFIGDDLREIPIVERILKNENEILYMHQDQVPYSRTQTYRDVVSIGKAIIRPVTHEILGVIIVDVDAQTVRELSEKIKIGQTGYFSVITEDGYYIYPPGETLNVAQVAPATLHTIANSTNGHLIYPGDESRELVVFDTYSNAGWKIVGRVDINEVMGSAQHIRGVTISVMLFAMVLTLILYFFISDAITHPLRDLTAKMKEAERGDLTVWAESRNHDEIADLCHSFNVMIEELKELLQRRVEDEENRKKFELKALQAQINPHFLYNTLDAIVWMSEANDRKSVVKTTKALSSFFRIALSKGEEWIALGDEEEHIRNYLLIQKMRHRDLLEYEISFQPEIREERVLKLMLQPIVENAVEHGIKNRRGGGKVEVVAGRTESDEIHLSVTDNGPGFSDDRLNAVRRELSETVVNIGRDHGFGIKNVNQRIQLYYGVQWGVEISSTEGKGTTVTIRLPSVQRETVHA